MFNVILVSKEGIEVRFKFKPLARKAEFKNKIVGIDQGQRKLFTAVAVETIVTTAGTYGTCSNEINEKTLKETDLTSKLHNHTYNGICDKRSS